MSHEGIRFVNKEEQARENVADRPLPRIAVTPEKVRVKITEGTGLEIDWQDGHRSAWNFAWLRWACPCATCIEERQQTGRAVGVPKPKPGGPLVMYEAPPRPVEVTPVGNYAVRFKWNDGHEAGLYSWDYLRNVCDVERQRQGQG